MRAQSTSVSWAVETALLGKQISRSSEQAWRRCVGELFLILGFFMMTAPPAWGQSEATTATLCVWYRQHVAQALEGGNLDFATTAPVGSGSWRATGHTLALVGVLAGKSCAEAAPASVARVWLERSLRDNSGQTTSSTDLTPPWFERARFLRLLAAARGHLEQGLTQVAVQRAEAALQEILSWQDDNGLIWSDGQRTRTTLLDNLEALLALRAAASFFRSLQRVALAREAQAAADRLYEAIETKLWRQELGRYAWAVESTGTLQTRATRWSPDMVSQLAAVAFLTPHSGLRQLYDDLLAGLDLEKINAGRPRDVEILAWYALAAQNAGAGEIYRRLKRSLQELPVSTWNALPAETCLIVALVLRQPGS